MTELEIKKTTKVLSDYVWSKYNPTDGMWHDTFFKDNPLTMQESEDAVNLYVDTCVSVYGDVMCENGDTECIRDIILSKRGKDYTELLCGLWIRNYIQDKPVGVVEFRSLMRKRKKNEYEEMKKTNPGYISHNTFREYWLSEWDAICMNGWVDNFLDKIYNNNR
jgi:hypothetical protein